MKSPPTRLHRTVKAFGFDQASAEETHPIANSALSRFIMRNRARLLQSSLWKLHCIIKNRHETCPAGCAKQHSDLVTDLQWCGPPSGGQPQ